MKIGYQREPEMKYHNGSTSYKMTAKEFIKILNQDFDLDIPESNEVTLPNGEVMTAMTISVSNNTDLYIHVVDASEVK